MHDIAPRIAAHIVADVEAGAACISDSGGSKDPPEQPTSVSVQVQTHINRHGQAPHPAHDTTHDKLHATIEWRKGTRHHE